MPVLNHPGGDIEYIAHQGRDDRPTAVFLHEGLGSVGQWGRLPALFHQETQMTTVVYSRHGYGGSAGTGPDGPRYLYSQALEVLPDVLAALDIRDPVLVGHSDGASIAAIHAGEYSVTAAVLIAPHIFVEDLTTSAIRSTAANFADTVGPSMSVFHDDPQELFRQWSTVWLSAEFAEFDITANLAEITDPLLVIQGSEDEYGSRAQVDVVAKTAAGPVEVALLAEQGHHPHLRDAPAICRLIVDFLARSGFGADPARVPTARTQRDERENADGASHHAR